MAVSFDQEIVRYSFQSGKLSATVTGTTAWDDLSAFTLELVPPGAFFGAEEGQVAGKLLATNSVLRVTGYDVEPFGAITGTDGAGLPTYGKAKWTIKYSVPEFSTDEEESQEDGDPVKFLTHRMTSGGQFLTDKGAGWKFSNDEPLNEDVPIGKFVSTTQHDIEWPGVVSPPWSAMEQLKSKVNDAAFTLRGFPYPAETLLYLGYDASQDVFSDGARNWSITIHFEARLVPISGGFGGHNHFYDTKTKTFLKVTKGATTPYETADFGQLLGQ